MLCHCGTKVQITFGGGSADYRDFVKGSRVWERLRNSDLDGTKGSTLPVISWWFVSTLPARNQTANALSLLPCAILCCVIWQGTVFQRNLLPSCLEKKTDARRYSETILSNYTLWHRKGQNISSPSCFWQNSFGSLRECSIMKIIVLVLEFILH